MPMGPLPPAAEPDPPLPLRAAVTFRDNRTGKSVELPIEEGTLGPATIDIARLYPTLGLFTYDPGLSNTAACRSALCYIDGDKGTLQYRGYDILWLLEHCDHMDVCYLLLHGDLPLSAQRKDFVAQIKHRSLLDENMKRVLEGFRHDAHPMAVMVGAVGALSAFYSLKDDTPARRELLALRLIAKLPTVAAWAYRHLRGQPLVYPRMDLSYAGNFLYMLLATPGEHYVVDPVMEKALDAMLVMHAEAEQTGPTTTVRTAASSHANPLACVAAGIAALWGPSNRVSEAVITMLEMIGTPDRIPEFLARAKDPTDAFRLMGFGHRAIKTYDPRAKFLRELCQQLVAHTGRPDPLLTLALDLERAALADEYFQQRRLFPNLNFYSGIVFRTMGFETRMFPVFFTVGRAVGWIAHWKEMMEDRHMRIVRPRQLYIGPVPSKL